MVNPNNPHKSVTISVWNINKYSYVLRFVVLLSSPKSWGTLALGPSPYGNYLSRWNDVRQSFLNNGNPYTGKTVHIDGIFPWCWCSAWLVVHQIQNRRTLAIFTLIARFIGPTWGPPGADRTDRAPCWPTQPCYLGISLSRSAQLGLTASGTKVVWNPACILFHFRKPCLYSHNNTEHD